MLGVATEHLYEHRQNQGRRDLYERMWNRGQRGRIWSALIGRSRRLLALAEVDDTCTVRDRFYAGVRAVPIDQIRGSEGRSNDFDRDFYPLQTHTKQRWLSVARARQQGKALPPVQLVRVGEVYFCMDGHHRISVARTFGQRYIEARVTVWQVSGPLPWERPTAVSGRASQKPGNKGLCEKVREAITEPGERTALNLQSPMSLLGAT
jgi:hypothetical protein